VFIVAPGAGEVKLSLKFVGTRDANDNGRDGDGGSRSPFQPSLLRVLAEGFEPPTWAV
jgi:hypothetical protein